MALDWLPTYPQPVWRKARRWPYDQAERLNVSPIPNPLPPVDLTWQPHYPDWISRHSLRRGAFQVVGTGFPFLGTQLQARTYYPDYFVRRRTPQEGGSPFTISSYLGTALYAWRPSYPDRPPRRPLLRLGAFVWVVDPTTLVNAATCLEWTAETLATPLLTPETATSPALTPETFVSPTLSEEDLC